MERISVQDMHMYLTNIFGRFPCICGSPFYLHAGFEL